MTTHIPHFIDGQRTAGRSTRTADVFDPNTGQVQATVPMASPADVDAAVASAVEAQKGWAAWNPQRRARVLMRFIELVNDNNDELAELLSLEHGKTLADAAGDIQRGIEVIEFCLGIPHLLKGEYTEGAGPGIDVYSLRQPLGVVAGITPFNFPAMIPLWKAGPPLPAETRSCSSRVSATRRSRYGWPNCSPKPACPRGIPGRARRQGSRRRHPQPP
ncbi:aldehyde dehydrogenase family protein [Mycobacterium kansasii 732]|nr:aldehyde dehydrogenase family protein [Mycobacterium kansasii 732]